MFASSKKKSCEPVKRRQEGKELWQIRMLRKKILVFHRRVHYASVERSGIWTCSSRDYQKATQKVRKMKLSGVHMQVHV